MINQNTFQKCYNLVYFSDEKDKIFNAKNINEFTKIKNKAIETFDNCLNDNRYKKDEIEKYKKILYDLEQINDEEFFNKFQKEIEENKFGQILECFDKQVNEIKAKNIPQYYLQFKFYIDYLLSKGNQKHIELFILNMSNNEITFILLYIIKYEKKFIESLKRGKILQILINRVPNYDEYKGSKKIFYEEINKKLESYFKK